MVATGTGGRRRCEAPGPRLRFIGPPQENANGLEPAPRVGRAARIRGAQSLGGAEAAPPQTGPGLRRAAPPRFRDEPPLCSVASLAPSAGTFGLPIAESLN